MFRDICWPRDQWNYSDWKKSQIVLYTLYCTAGLSYFVWMCCHVNVWTLLILLRLHRKLIEIKDAFLKARMLAFCDLTWWKNQSTQRKLPSLDGRPIPCHYTDACVRTRAAVPQARGLPLRYPECRHSRGSCWLFCCLLYVYLTKLITQLVNGWISVCICGVVQSVWDILLNYSQIIFVHRAGVKSLQHDSLSPNSDWSKWLFRSQALAKRLQV